LRLGWRIRCSLSLAARSDDDPFTEPAASPHPPTIVYRVAFEPPQILTRDTLPNGYLWHDVLVASGDLSP